MAAGDLCAVADVQAFLSLSSGQDAALLQTLVTNASQFVVNYINRSILSATYTETRNGHGGSSMMLRNSPITAITSVTMDNVAVLAAVPGGTSGYINDASVLYLRGGQMFTRDVQNVTIVYTAGYASVPADIAQATIEIVATKYKRRQNIEVSGRTLNGETISYTTSDLPASAKRALQPYQIVFTP